MSTTLDIFCFDIPFTVLFSAVLSFDTDVCNCERTISDRALCMDVYFWKFSNNPPNSDSVIDAVVFIMILHSTYTGPFSGKFLLLVCWIFSGEKYPPDLLRASGYKM